MPKQGNIKVLIVDDSRYMRYVLGRILNEPPDIEVVGDARDGADALRKIETLRPDVVTLDFEMPGMNGLETLSEICRRFATPTIMFSQYTAAGGEITIRALETGAVDFVLKPTGKEALTLDSVRDELIAKVRAASRAVVTPADTRRPAVTPFRKPLLPITPATEMKKIVVVGSSTGGPKALVTLFKDIPAHLPMGFIIVQHMPPGFTASLSARLNEISPLQVAEAAEGDRLAAGKALLAPGDFHLEIKRDRRVTLSSAPTLHGVRPAVDVTLESAAAVFGEKVVCVILTGMGHDGTMGGTIVKQRGGLTIAQEASTCVVDGMPGSLIKAGQADRIVPMDNIAAEIAALA